MKILMTGMTAAHTATDGDVRISGAFAMLEALEKFMGHTVTVAQPSVHTRPEDYDCILCGLYVFNARTSRHKLKLFEFLHRAYAAKVPVHFYIDDWHLSNIMSSLRRNTPALYKSFEKLIVPMEQGGMWAGGGEDELENVKAHRKEIWDTRLKIGHFQDIPANTKIFVQFFPWHDASNIRKIIKWPAENVVPWNPDAFLLERARAIQPGLTREKAWVVSTPYKDFDGWVEKQGFKWPIMRTGRKGTHKERTEPDLFQNVYASNWGVVSHPYPKSVVGMWRNRYLFALHAGAVIYSALPEVKDLGLSFAPVLVKSYEEEGNVDKLQELNQRQLKEFMAKQTSPEFEMQKFEGLV